MHKSICFYVTCACFGSTTKQYASSEGVWKLTPALFHAQWPDFECSFSYVKAKDRTNATCPTAEEPSSSCRICSNTWGTTTRRSRGPKTGPSIVTFAVKASQPRVALGHTRPRSVMYVFPHQPPFFTLIYYFINISFQMDRLHLITILGKKFILENLHENFVISSHSSIIRIFVNWDLSI